MAGRFKGWLFNRLYKAASFGPLPKWAEAESKGYLEARLPVLLSALDPASNHRSALLLSILLSTCRQPTWAAASKLCYQPLTFRQVPRCKNFCGRNT